MYIITFFFFKQKTAYEMRISDWSSDVCSSDLHPKEALTIKSWLEDVPYHYFPITKDTKAEQEARIKATIEATGAELIILARYMQILSDDLASFLSGRCINIHHSFL